MKTKLVALIIIGVVIGGLILYGALSNYIQNYNYEINKTEYLANQPTISVTGIIQYWQPIDGPSYSIIPEEDIDFEINEHRGIFLYGQLSPSLEGKRVTVSGILIENYVDFQLKTLGGAFGGDPNTAVILVDKVLSSEIENALSSYMGKIVPTLDDFKNALSESQDIETIFFKFGEPHDDIGSGIHIYVYELNDSTQVWIGYTDKILYVRHVDVEGNILEKLFNLEEKENEN